jgi:hypothetical protein
MSIAGMFFVELFEDVVPDSGTGFAEVAEEVTGGGAAVASCEIWSTRTAEGGARCAQAGTAPQTRAENGHPVDVLEWQVRCEVLHRRHARGACDQ